VQAQLDVVSRRLAALSESVEKTAQISQPAQDIDATPKAASRSPIQKPREMRRTTPAPRPVVPRPDPQVDQLQTRLSGQEKELASTRDQLVQTRQDLEGQLGATRDELTGPIARTHDELQALERRGEMNYYEFDIVKNKEFSRIGPLALSLRKADTKRRSYQVRFRIGDKELEKKNVILFEPILISAPSSPQPLQLVVNEITKDRVRGYVSEPKVRQPAAPLSNAQPQSLQVRQ
jgi:septal ring factor EnvC (AmiA/AmiB activator)